MSQASTQTDYIPGVCNINHAEIAYRRKAGYYGLVATLIVFGVLYTFDVNSWFRLVIFASAFVATIGFLQSKNKFCVAYGAAGTQNATDGSEVATSVTDKKAVLRDKIKARSMNLQAVVIAAGVALFACLI